MLIDSDLLIWVSRNHAGAIARLQTIEHWQVSAVAYIELIQGCRNRQELESIDSCNAKIDQYESHL